MPSGTGFAESRICSAFSRPQWAAFGSKTLGPNLGLAIAGPVRLAARFGELAGVSFDLPLPEQALAVRASQVCVMAVVFVRRG